MQINENKIKLVTSTAGAYCTVLHSPNMSSDHMM